MPGNPFHTYVNVRLDGDEQKQRRRRSGTTFHLEVLIELNVTPFAEELSSSLFSSL